jgi:hypothetical protein
VSSWPPRRCSPPPRSLPGRRHAAAPDDRDGRRHPARLGRHQAERDRVGREHARGELHVRSRRGRPNFGELFGHIANAQFNNCAVASGKDNPNQGKDQELLAKTKAEVVAALKASFDFCDPVYAALTDASAMEMVKQGNNTAARGYILFNNVAHSNEMYGTSAAYYRAKNMVPPSTERTQRSRR